MMVVVVSAARVYSSLYDGGTNEKHALCVGCTRIKELNKEKVVVVAQGGFQTPFSRNAVAVQHAY
jgi:hypothetical protein